MNDALDVTASSRFMHYMWSRNGWPPEDTRGLWAAFLLRCSITVHCRELKHAPIAQLLCPTNVAYPVVLGSGESKNLKGVHCHAKVVQRWLLCLCESARACCACVSLCAYVRASATQVNYFVRFSVCVILCTALQP